MPSKKILNCLIIKLEFGVTSIVTCVVDCVRPGKPWFQFVKHPNGYLHMGISRLKFHEKCKFSHFHNVFIVLYTQTFG